MSCLVGRLRLVHVDVLRDHVPALYPVGGLVAKLEVFRGILLGLLALFRFLPHVASRLRSLKPTS